MLRVSNSKSGEKKTYRGFVDPTGRAVFAGARDVRRAPFVGQVFPNFANLFDPLGPVGELLAQVDVVDVSVQDHGYGGQLT